MVRSASSRRRSTGSPGSTERKGWRPETEEDRAYLALVRRAETGEEAALAELREMYDRLPALREGTGHLAK